jgi:NADPH:quinone reductase
MKAWRVHAWGEPESMQLDDIVPPEPGPGQVRIRHRAAALNFFDILQVQGKYQVKPPFPFTPGAEAAGVVDAVGSEVRHLKPGDAVLAFVSGGFAESSVTDANRAFPIPAGMDFAEAAAMPIVYHTSWYALRKRTTLERGEWLLVHAGASGVGMSAIQIGKALGARVIATAGSAEKWDFCLAQGAEHALDYRDAAWPDRVKELTGNRGVDVVYDPVGGDVFDLSTKCIAPDGRLLVIGFASGRIPAIQANRILLKNIAIVGVFWGAHVQRLPEYLVETQQALATMYMAGQIRPIVGKTWPLDSAPAALRELADRKVTGKSVLKMYNHVDAQTSN